MINTSSVPAASANRLKVRSRVGARSVWARRGRSSTLKAMELILGGIVVAFLVLVLVGAVTGRVKAQSCCSMSATDPRRDLRMAAAFRDEPLR